MESQSILYLTLWLFAGAFVAAVLTLLGFIWLILRKGKDPRGRSREAAASAGFRVPADFTDRCSTR